MTDSTDNTVVRGTANIFADLGYADADTQLLKAGLVSRIHDVVIERKFTQAEAAKRMGISQPDVSRLLRGQFREISIERLIRVLTRLGCDVDIVVRAHGRKAAPKDTIRLQATSP